MKQRTEPWATWDVFPFRPGLATGNIRWADTRSTGYSWSSRFASRNGRFPSTHPVAPGSDVFQRDLGSQCGLSDSLTAFRARGYWASCFPEGDGITWYPIMPKTDAECLVDIREAFGHAAEWTEYAKTQLDGGLRVAQ